MLVQLTIRNLALIAQAEVRLSRGFIAVTGETGAGKSVLLSGLRLVCGAKAVAQMVRHGEEKASVEAIFDLAGLSEVLYNAKSSPMAKAAPVSTEPWSIKATCRTLANCWCKCTDKANKSCCAIPAPS